MRLKDLRSTKHLQHIAQLTAAIEQHWPGHLPLVERTFAGRLEDEMLFIDDLARRFLNIYTGNLEYTIDSYKKVCLQYMQAEAYYRKYHAYRSSDFGDVYDGLYQHTDAMNSYMTGLGLALIFWWQNTGPQYFFFGEIGARRSLSGRILEVGPGHGILTSLLLESDGASVIGLDVSAESLAMTERCLARLGHTRGFEPHLGDVCDALPEISANGAVVSQVLEIVSDPAAAMANIRGALEDGAWIFVNAPVDFAAPDHIRRWSASEEVDVLLKDQGFQIVETRRYPAVTASDASAAGYSYAVFAEAA